MARFRRPSVKKGVLEERIINSGYQNVMLSRNCCDSLAFCRNDLLGSD
jgi:hypothetical protein